jgi:signal transduction histidine kinase
VRIDADRIGQVLGNLLDNALRHTPPGGTVTLACRRVDNWVEYRVADTGDGVAADHLPHLFDRFYRVDTARDRGHGGSGIGLAIAKALVESHGGGISVTSPGPGHGTTFRVRLPDHR